MKGAAPNSRGVLWILIASACASALFAIRIWDWDDWWHLATGRWIAQHGTIPSVDPFSYTAAGQDWPALPWLSELALYGAHSLAGPAGVVACQVLCAFATLLFLGLSLLELGVDKRLSVAQLLLTAIIVQERYARGRPETLAAVLLALAVLLLVRWWCRRDRSLLAMIPLTLLWIPIHASATMAIGLSMVAVVITLPSPDRRRHVVLPILTLVGVVLTFAATRTGREIVELGMRATRSASPVAIGITEEWRAPTFADGSIWIPLLATVAAGIFCATRRQRALLPLLLALIGFMLAARSIRHIAPGILLSTPAWGMALHALNEWLIKRNLKLGSLVLPWVVGLGLGLAHLSLSPFERNRIAFGFGIVEERYPSDSVDLLETLPTGRTIHNMHFGGYLIWRQLPGGVFWDGRTVGLYTDEQIINIFLPAERDEESLERIADQFDVHYGLACETTSLGSVMMMSTGWIPVQHGRTATVFVRRKHAGTLARSGIPLLNLLRITPNASWNLQWYSRVLRDPHAQKDLVRSIGSQLQQNPTSPAFLVILHHLSAHHPTFYDTLPTSLAEKFPTVRLPD